MRWLAPRLRRFNERYPSIEVTVDTSHRRVEFARDGIDFAVRMGKGDWPGLHATCLVARSSFPCARRIWLRASARAKISARRRCYM
jgi:DNA-binding transcriptional LysR family regulator